MGPGQQLATVAVGGLDNWSARPVYKFRRKPPAIIRPAADYRETPYESAFVPAARAVVIVRALARVVCSDCRRDTIGLAQLLAALPHFMW